MLNSTKIHFSTIIVGGGIVGAGLFRDLALQGQDCLLVDKFDFTSQTSQSSSKMLHGGIRYLENMDFALVKEALHEKNLWLKLAPHLCYEKSFLLPTYSDSLRPLWMLKCGLLLYDFLSGFKNTPHRIISATKTQQALKGLKTKNLSGSGLYHDAIVDDSKLTLEVIYDALKEPGNKAYNYTEYVSHEHISKSEIKVLLKDNISGEQKEFYCEDLVFATGPFTDKILKNQKEINWTPQLLPSKGSHFWIKKEDLPIESALVLTPKDGRVIFVIPQKNAVLVGTTEVKITGDFFNIDISHEEEAYLLENLNEYFPELAISKKSILQSFAGIRPLVKEESSSDLSKTAREHKVFQPRSNIHVIVGGKYTTFRKMVQETAQTICNKKKITYNDLKTLAPLRQRSVILPFDKKLSISKETIERIVKQELARTPQDVIKRRINRIDLTDDQEALINKYFQELGSI